jgi:hypothetical protein
MERRGDRRRQPGQQGQEEVRVPNSLNFHYDRDERLSMASEELREAGRQQSFFRRYRGPLLMLVDVALLVGMIGLFVWLTGGEQRASLPGYSVTLRAARFGQQALVTVTIEQTEASPELSGDIVELAMSVPGTSLSVTEKDVLPAKKGQVRTIRAVLEPLPESSHPQNKNKSVFVVVRAADHTAKLSVVMQNE